MVNFILIMRKYLNQDKAIIRCFWIEEKHQYPIVLDLDLTFDPDFSWRRLEATKTSEKMKKRKEN